MSSKERRYRHRERPLTRKAGAGRPRNEARNGGGPVDAEIVGAAAHLFAIHGVEGTTMAGIAEKVGLSVSSIYYYFANKQEVLERLVDEVNRAPLMIADEVALRFEDAPRKLHAFCRADVVALCEFPFDFSEVHRLAGRDLELFANYWADRRRLLARITGFIEQGISEGDLLPVNASLAAITLLSNDEAVQNWRRSDASVIDSQTVTPEEVGLFVADMTVRALLVDSSNWAALGAETGSVES